MVQKEDMEQVVYFNNLNREDKQGKKAKCDYKSSRNSASSQKGAQMTGDQNVKQASRVLQKVSRKQLMESLSRPTRSASERQEPTKKHYIASNNNRKMLEKTNKVPTRTKNLSDQRPENVKVSGRSSSESSEGSEEKVIEEKAFEEIKEIDVMDATTDYNQGVGSDSETVDTEENSFDEDKVNTCEKMEEMELRIEKLEEELRVVAALEISLYSVVPAHRSSTHKVHTPARRLSRLYIHACKHWTRKKQATIARNTVSGLVLIARSCGSDVPRLTFWLSNTVVLREIIAGAFRNAPHSCLIKSAGQLNGVTNKTEGKSSIMRWNTNPGMKMLSKPGFLIDDWQETGTFTAALEKVEAWIFSQIVELVWWQILTPQMHSPIENVSKRKFQGKLLGPALGEQLQGTFSTELWKNAILDAFSRLCPLRAEGHQCGCLPVLARMVMEQCTSRLDVAMFNAILRESACQVPTDPVSDPIIDPKVLPIPAGDLSFGSGAQLKNSIGNWSRCLEDLFGMDSDDSHKDNLVSKNDDDNRRGGDTQFNYFCLLDSLSDLLMLPKDMLLDKSIRKEVCPLIGPAVITRVLCNFTPDEFCPDPVPAAVLEELNSERLSDRCLSDMHHISSTLPCAAPPVVYTFPSAADMARKMSDAGGKTVGRNSFMVQRKGYTSDEELDDMDSPLITIIDKAPSVSSFIGNSGAGNLKKDPHANMRFELLRKVWSL